MADKEEKDLKVEPEKEHHHHHHEHHEHHHHHSKEGKVEDGKELKIDIDADIPLSKKEIRMIKKGKVTLEELQKKKKKKSGEIPNIAEGKAPGLLNNSKKTKYGVWIGNLSYETSKEDLVTFLSAKTEQYSDADDKEEDKEDTSDEEDKSEEKEDNTMSHIKEVDILRINMPMKLKRNTGFAYVDFRTKSEQNSAISLSEMDLNGRDLLIKKSDSFKGRPAKTFPVSHNPPSRILFVGNLPFDITEDQLKSQFMHCGEIVKIRMATFEDSGKCKGFAFLDFKDDQGPTAALKDKTCHEIMHRPLRMEYGEDRSKRRVHSGRRFEQGSGNRDDYHRNQPRHDNYNEDRGNNNRDYDQQSSNSRYPVRERRTSQRQFGGEKRYRRADDMAPNKRMKSSIALANAQRENPGVKAKGKKITFD